MIITNLFNKFAKMSFILLLAFSISVVNAADYAPVVELDLKAGNKRGIGRIGTLIPIYSDDSFLTYSSIFVMKDTISGLEGNLGLGLRKMINNSYILGIYGFGDLRRSLNKKQAIFQANLGAELFFEHLEFRMNTYFPLSKDVLLDKVSTDIYSNYDSAANQTTETRTSNDRYEVLLKGYDLDIGGNIPNYTQFKAYGGFYHFFNKGISLVGAKFRAEYAIRDWLSVGGEVNYDTKRKWSNYADVKLKYSFDKKGSSNLSNLQKKMTLLPVRDVDIVTQDKVVSDKYLDQTTEGKTLYFATGSIEDYNNNKINLSGNTIEYLDTEQGPSGIYKGEDLANIVLVDSSGKTQSTVKKDNTIDKKVQAKLKTIVLKKGLYINSSNVKSSAFKSVIKDINKDISIATIKNARSKGNINSQQMFDDGVPFSKLKKSGITINNMLTEGIKPTTLKKEGVKAKPMLDTNLVTPETLKSIGFTARQLKDANVSINKLIEISTASELLPLYSVAELVGQNIDLKELREANVNVNQIPNSVSPRRLLQEGGYSERDLLAKYDAVRIVRAGGDLDALRRAGVDSAALQALRDNNELTVRQMIDNGNYSIEQLVNDPNIGVDDLKDARVQLDQISGYATISNLDLVTAGYDVGQIISSRNTTYRDLVETDNITPQTLIGRGATVDDLLGDGGFTVGELLDKNIKVRDLKATDRPDMLAKLIDENVSVRTLLGMYGGYTLDEIIVDPRMTPKKLNDEGVGIDRLKEKFTIADMYANEVSIAKLRTTYSIDELLDELTVKNLIDGEVSYEDLKASEVPVQKIIEAKPNANSNTLHRSGYTYSDMLKNSDITLKKLLKEGATPRKFKNEPNGTPEVTGRMLYDAKISARVYATTIEKIVDAGYNLSLEVQKKGVRVRDILDRYIQEYKRSNDKRLPTQARVKEYLSNKGNIEERSIQKWIDKYNENNITKLR